MKRVLIIVAALSMLVCLPGVLAYNPCSNNLFPILKIDYGNGTAVYQNFNFAAGGIYTNITTVDGITYSINLGSSVCSNYKCNLPLTLGPGSTYTSPGSDDLCNVQITTTACTACPSTNLTCAVCPTLPNVTCASGNSTTNVSVYVPNYTYPNYTIPNITCPAYNPQTCPNITLNPTVIPCSSTDIIGWGGWIGWVGFVIAILILVVIGLVSKFIRRPSNQGNQGNPGNAGGGGGEPGFPDFGPSPG